MKLLDFLSIVCLLSVLSTIKAFGNQLWKNRRSFTSPQAVKSVYSVEEFDSIVKESGNKLVVIDYATTWCVPCKAIEPKYVALSENYPQVLFLKCIDGDPDHPECTDLMMREGIKSVPAFHFWKEGSKHEKITGARIEDVEQAVKSFLRS